MNIAPDTSGSMHGDDPIAQFPLLERHMMICNAEFFRHNSVLRTTDETLEAIRVQFDAFGPFMYADFNRLLRNGSGEEFALQFMAAYNMIKPGTY